MYDREIAQMALADMSVEKQAEVQRIARIRGIAACDVVLEVGLMVAQEQSREALYALKERRARPVLRAVS